jgi:hypothetical protein
MVTDAVLQGIAGRARRYAQSQRLPCQQMVSLAARERSLPENQRRLLRTMRKREARRARSAIVAGLTLFQVIYYAVKILLWVRWVVKSLESPPGVPVPTPEATADREAR